MLVVIVEVDMMLMVVVEVVMEVMVMPMGMLELLAVVSLVRLPVCFKEVEDVEIEGTMYCMNV